MPLFTKDPEKEAQKEREAEERARAAAEEAFRNSPVGQAREAKGAGRRFFQVSLPLSETQRTASGVISGDKNAIRTMESAEHPTVLEEIEAEGWRLEHAGYVFQETGSVSRDKLLSTGQTASVTGRVIGIYLFRVVASGSA